MGRKNNISRAYELGYLSDNAKNRAISDLELHLNQQLEEISKQSTKIRNQFSDNEWMAVCYKIKLNMIDLKELRTPYVFG